jgi:hypothetical protein
MHGYLDVAQKLRDLNADDPGHGDLMPGGTCRRKILTVDARGPKGAPQDIPKGLRCEDVTKDRQYTDQRLELECGPHTAQSDTTRCGVGRVGHAAKRPRLY